jgi:hypothetical protein
LSANLEQQLEMGEHNTSNDERFLRRRQAADYLLSKYGFGATATLAKGAVTGDTPAYCKAGKIVLYTKQSLDEWALRKIGPLRHSTSEIPFGMASPARQSNDASSRKSARSPFGLGHTRLDIGGEK